MIILQLIPSPVAKPDSDASIKPNSKKNYPQFGKRKIHNNTIYMYM